MIDPLGGLRAVELLVDGDRAVDEVVARRRVAVGRRDRKTGFPARLSRRRLKRPNTSAGTKPRAPARRRAGAIAVDGVQHAVVRAVEHDRPDRAAVVDDGRPRMQDVAVEAGTHRGRRPPGPSSSPLLSLPRTQSIRSARSAAVVAPSIAAVIDVFAVSKRVVVAGAERGTGGAADAGENARAVWRSRKRVRRPCATPPFSTTSPSGESLGDAACPSDR